MGEHSPPFSQRAYPLTNDVPRTIRRLRPTGKCVRPGRLNKKHLNTDPTLIILTGSPTHKWQTIHKVNYWAYEPPITSNPDDLPLTKASTRTNRWFRTVNVQWPSTVVDIANLTNRQMQNSNETSTQIPIWPGKFNARYKAAGRTHNIKCIKLLRTAEQVQPNHPGHN